MYKRQGHCKRKDGAVRFGRQSINPVSYTHLPYILGKLTHGVLSAIITMVLLMLFPVEHSVFAADALLYIAPTPRELVITALISIFWCAVSMLSLIHI